MFIGKFNNIQINDQNFLIIFPFRFISCLFSKSSGFITLSASLIILTCLVIHLFIHWIGFAFFRNSRQCTKCCLLLFFCHISKPMRLVGLTNSLTGWNWTGTCDSLISFWGTVAHIWYGISNTAALYMWIKLMQ